jgi:hypothetical protein
VTKKAKGLLEEESTGEGGKTWREIGETGERERDKECLWSLKTATRQREANTIRDEGRDHHSHYSQWLA